MRALRWFKRGTWGLIIMAIAHFVTNAKGLPISVDNGLGKELVDLMATYKINFFGLDRTLDQTLAGYAYTWGAMLLGIAAVNFALAGKNPGKAPPAALRWLNLLVWGICCAVSILYWSYPQMIIFGLIAGCFLIAVLPERRGQKKPPVGNRFNPRVAIIGAGPAGLTSAWELRNKGYTDITIFEKEQTVGGKCYTKSAGDYEIDVGAHEMLAGYTDVMEIAGELDIASHGHQNVLVYDHRPKEFFDVMTASTNAGYSKLQIGLASIRYTWMLLTRYRKFAKPGTGLADAPLELQQPVGSWIAQMRLEPLREIIVFIMTVQCYGRMDEVAAAYFVKFQGFKNWTSNVLHSIGLTQRWPRVFTKGFQNVWVKLAETFDDVRTSAEITSVKRVFKPNSIETGIEITQQGKQPEMFDRLILACPLDIPTLKGLGMELEEQERALFAKIKYNTIIATSVHVEGIPEGVVGSIPLPQMLDYTGYIKVYKDCDVVIFFAVSPRSAEEVSQDPEYLQDIYQRIVDDVAKLPPTMGVPPKVTGMFYQKAWPYFPHPDITDMADGFFAKMHALQGRQNTVYTGSLFEMETVGNTVANARCTINEYFPKLY